MFLTLQLRTVIRLTVEIARISTGDYYRQTQELRRCAPQVSTPPELSLMLFLVCHSCTSATDILTSHHCCARVTQRANRGDLKSNQRLSETSSYQLQHSSVKGGSASSQCSTEERNESYSSYLGMPLGLTKACSFSDSRNFRGALSVIILRYLIYVNDAKLLSVNATSTWDIHWESHCNVITAYPMGILISHCIHILGILNYDFYKLNMKSLLTSYCKCPQ